MSNGNSNLNSTEAILSDLSSNANACPDIKPRKELGEAAVLDATVLSIPGGPSATESTEDELELTPESQIKWTKLKKLTAKQEVLCHMAASGFSNQRICQELGYSDSRCSILLNDPLIKDRVREIRDGFWSQDVKQRFQRAVGPAMKVVEDALDTNNYKYRPKEKLDAAKWLLEKQTGKASQTLEVRGNLLLEVLSKLDQIKDVTPNHQITAEVGQPESTVKALTEPENTDPIDKWVKENLGNK